MQKLFCRSRKLRSKISPPLSSDFDLVICSELQLFRVDTRLAVSAVDEPSRTFDNVLYHSLFIIPALKGQTGLGRLLQ
jgi:hypothetical protein